MHDFEHMLDFFFIFDTYTHLYLLICMNNKIENILRLYMFFIGLQTNRGLYDGTVRVGQLE